jgi:hypothetical protein
MSSSAPSISFGRKGDTVCRPTEWSDVLKFFLLNYGLHAFTAFSQPGSSTLHRVFNVISSIFVPYSGMYRALDAIANGLMTANNPLENAANADALCMVVKKTED